MNLIPEALYNSAALNKRFADIYARQRDRAKPKFWKNGKKKGNLRVPGILSLPYTKDELVAHVVGLLGTGLVRCPYCVAIGRPARLIDLTNCVLDHKEPASRGGAWTLKNLVPCCEDCNTCKGNASYAFFIAIMSEMEKWPDQGDRTYMYACLRSHGRTAAIRFGKGKAKEETKELPPPKTASLDFDDFNGPTTPPLTRKEPF